jgi:hypothetical protein
MGGGLMQLVAYGAQDIYLTGNPQITFFKVVYRRHTNFAVEAIEQTYNGSLGQNSRISVTVSRNGDLLSRVWIKGDNVSFGNIQYVECEIGGQVIDKQYGEWMALWCDLTHNKDQATMLGNLSGYVPLQFWFCRNPGLALPLIALQYHEVKLNIQLADQGNGNAPTALAVYCDYIFLDTDERRRFAQVSHEYLIEQTQFSNVLSAGNANGTTAVNKQVELRFNHPVKELVWTIEQTASTVDNDDGAPAGKSADLHDALLQLNGHDRFKRREGDYFTGVQRYQHHSGSQNLFADSKPAVYSFALKPEEHQPSGTCNFSRIDNAVLNVNWKLNSGTTGATAAITTAAHSLRVYAVNYNVLRVMSGMGGLAYSN